MHRLLIGLFAAALALVGQPAAAQFSTPGQRPHAGHGYCYAINSAGNLQSQLAPCTVANGQAPPMRGFNTALPGNTASWNQTFPAGSAVGDFAVVCGANGFQVNVTAGWATISQLTGSQFNGACFSKTLTSGDISSGFVTITATGSFNAVSGIVVMTGTASVRTHNESRNGSGTSPIVVASDSTPVAGDFIFYWGSNRSGAAGGVDTVSLGVQRAQIADTVVTGVLNTQVPVAPGAVSPSYSYSVVGVGNFQSLIVIKGS